MRDIKFRGVTYDDIVVYGKGLKQQMDMIMIQEDDGIWNAIRPETLEQFTGHQDSKGNDVYCGDKLRSGGTQTGILTIKETRSGWMPFKSGRQSNWDAVKRATIIK